MDDTFPTIIDAPSVRNLAAWVTEQRSQLHERIAATGALLFRGFEVTTPDRFADFIRAATSGAMPYTERSSPRRAVMADANIYTSTQYPEERSIFLHNEQSYNLRFPRFICFGCLRAPAAGGQTLIADTRSILRRLDPATVRTLHERKYSYVRNFDGMFGLPWTVAFQVKDRSELEKYCDDNQISIDVEGSSLRTRQVREVVARHPWSGELCWFNHLTFFHARSLDPDIAEVLRQTYPDERSFPNSTCYGDGASIDAAIVDELRGAYTAETVRFDWQPGDVLLLDNVLAAHGRAPYSGDREIITAMTDPLDWDAVVVREALPI